MKKAMKIVLAMAMVLLMSGGAMAEGTFVPQGGVTVPGIVYLYTSSSNYMLPRFVLTNITGETIQCKVRVYDHDDNDITHLSQIVKGGQGSWPTLATGTGDFEIPAHSTRLYWMLSPSGIKRTAGYATIEWSSSDSKLRKALIGSIWRMRSGVGGFTDTNNPLNNSQPF